MTFLSSLWPRQDERRLLGRFYLAGGLSELFNVIWPFQFAYLFMVMERPEWAVIPLLVESGTALIAEIPTGALADRYSRRQAVILGNSLSAVGLGLVPFSAQQTGPDQLIAVSASFAVWGLGQALVSGAGEAWVVDNLVVAGRRDLTDSYFARISSFGSLGAVGAGALALLLLLSLDISRQSLDALWYIAACGLLVAALFQATISERRPGPAAVDTQDKGASVLATVLLGLRTIRRSRRLLFFAVALVIASFPESAADDAFDMSLITKGMDARGLAPLGIVDNLIGMAAPLIGMLLLHRFGATRVLSFFLIIPTLAVSALFVAPLLAVVIGLYILLDFVDGVWDPVANARLQTLVTSQSRATVASTVNHAGGVMELLGLAVLVLLLGEHSEQLSDAVPDLITAFSGRESHVMAAPVMQYGLSVPDLAIVVLMFSLLLALPFILLSARSR